MSQEITQLYRLIQQYRLDWRHPLELEPIVRKIEKGRLRPDQARRWLKKIRPWIEQVTREGNYLPKAPTPQDMGIDQDPFDIPLGHSVERPETALGIRVRKGVQHVLILGKNNAGKSVTLRQYLRRIRELGQRHPTHRITCVLLDLKGDVPNPHVLFGDDFVHVTVHDPGQLRFALNGPPGVPGSAWSASVSTILAARLGLIISRSCLSACYNWLLPLLNPVPGPRLNAPSVRLILDVLTNSPSDCWGEKIDYIRTLVQQLSALLIDANGLLDADRGFEINQDIFAKDTNCVIHCADFGPPYLKYLIYDLLMTQCTSFLMHNQLKTNQTKRVIACEEGEFLVSHQAQAAYGDSLSPDATSARLLREYGVQLVIVASAPQHIDPFLVKSTDCVLAHCCVDPESIWYLRRMFMLEPECDKLLPALKPGQCIYREAQGPFPYPILGQIDLLEPDHTPKVGAYDSIPFTEARGLEHFPEVQEALQDRIRERTKTKLRQSPARQEKSPPLLNPSERAFLDYLSLHEFDPVHRLFARMGNPAPATQKRILDSLERKGLIRSHQIQTARVIRIARLTDPGWQYLNKQSKFSPLRGGDVHSFACRSVQALHVKRGCDECICEHHYPNSAGIGDVYTKINGKHHYTEVAIDFANITKHVRDCFLDSDKVESLTIVTLLKSEHEAIRTMILADPELVFCISRISFVTVDQILKELYHDESR